MLFSELYTIVCSQTMGLVQLAALGLPLVVSM